MARKAVPLITLIIEGNEVIAKECRGCFEVKPLELYNKTTDGSAGGRSSKCKDCKRKYREVNADKISARQKEHYRNNHASIREAQSVYYQDNKEKIDAVNKQWYTDNKERKLAYDKIYREQNREHGREVAKEWYKRNIDSERERSKIKLHHRRAIEKGLRTGFDEDWKGLILRVYGGCILTGTQDNIHWDHFIPLATGKGGSYAGNMVPLSASLNLQKGTKNPIDFLISKGMSYERIYDVLFILAWLNDMDVVEYVGYVYECFEEKEVG